MAMLVWCILGGKELLAAATGRRVSVFTSCGQDVTELQVRRLGGTAVALVERVGVEPPAPPMRQTIGPPHSDALCTGPPHPMRTDC